MRRNNLIILVSLCAFPLFGDGCHRQRPLSSAGNGVDASMGDVAMVHLTLGGQFEVLQAEKIKEIIAANSGGPISLTIQKCTIGPMAAKEIAEIQNLGSLELIDAQVCPMFFLQMPNNQFVGEIAFVGCSGVTRDGVHELRKKMPYCYITW